MEDWLAALKAASLREYYEPGLTDTQDFLANHHHWYDQYNGFDNYFPIGNCKKTNSAISNVPFQLGQFLKFMFLPFLFYIKQIGTFIFIIDPHIAMYAEI